MSNISKKIQGDEQEAKKIVAAITMVRGFFNTIMLIHQQRQLIVSMAMREVATEHVGSLLGFVWTFIHPLVLVLVFWLVFSVGFRVMPAGDAPFVVWLTAGMAPWFAFADIVNRSAGSVVSNAHLIKKTQFHSQILPVINVVSCLTTHAVFLAVLLGLTAFQGMSFSLWFFQAVYYLAAMTILSLGLGWAVAALNVFMRDIAQIVRVILQVGFWATPIFWDMEIMPRHVQTVLKLNPMFYIVQGYRDSFIYFRPFWERPWPGIYFWSVSAALFIAGAFIFKKLKPQFADVL